MNLLESEPGLYPLSAHPKIPEISHLTSGGAGLQSPQTFFRSLLGLPSNGGR